MKSKAAQILLPIVVLFLIASIMTALLGATDLLTRDTITALAAENEKKAVARVITAESYESRTITVDGAEQTYYAAVSGGETVGYAFTVSGSGYGGTVAAVVGMKTDRSITAVEVTDVSGETPGLGQNAKSAAFLGQFSGKKDTLTVVKQGAGEKQVQAVTGATITSKAVTSAVNSAFDLFDSIQKEGDAQ